MSIKRCYSDLIALKTFEERFKYLSLDGSVGEQTFGFERYLNQKFYVSGLWRRIRRDVIIRDNGCDLGIEDLEIRGSIYIHHMNVVKPKDFIEITDELINPEYLICVSRRTHYAIHYGDDATFLQSREIVERRPYDTCPWR